MDELIDLPWLDGAADEEQSAAAAPVSPRDRRRLFEDGSAFAPVAREQIVGIDGIVERVDELVHWLDHAGRYAEHGARLEPGVLFEGPPGTGKTLLARYLATRADALFVDVRDFPCATGKLSADDVEALFALARDAAAAGRPVVLFWDELDGIGWRRGPHGPVPSAVMLALLSELDGARGKPDGVLLVACTNHADALDPALLRPGRIGMHVSFRAPNRAGCEALIAHSTSRVETAGGLDLELLAGLMPCGVTASTVEEAVAEAWRLAVARAIREDTPPALTEGDLVATLARRIAGSPPAFASLRPDERLQVAVHEVGHGLVALANGVDVWLVSVEPGASVGRAVTGDLGLLPSADRLLTQLSIGLGGLVAEQVALGARGIGSCSDTLKASETALRLVENHGAGRRTGRFNPDAIVSRRPARTSDTSERLLADLDADARRLVARAERDAERLLRRIGRKRILALAAVLEERRTMTGPEFAREARALLGDPARHARRRWLRSS